MEEKKTEGANEMNLLDLCIVILKRKKMIFWGTIVIFLLTVITVYFILPQKYDAEVRFLPPPTTSSSMASALLSSMGSTVSSLAGSLLGTSAPGEMFGALLISRTVEDKIIDRYGLMERYKTWLNYIPFFPFYREDCRKKLTDDAMTVTVDDKSGIVSLVVEDEDPKIAANMANMFLDEMESLSKLMTITEANKRRVFYETQVKQTKESLTKAENDMKTFQEKTGVLQPDAQAVAVITNDAAIRAQIAAKEVEVKLLKTYATTNNPDLQKAEDGLRAMKAEQAKLEMRKGNGPDPLMPTGRMPSEGLAYARLLRDVKLYNTLYQLLISQYEAAKLDETRDIVVVQEVDRAVVPTKSAKPKRLLLMILGLFGGFFLMSGTALLMDYKEKISRDPVNKDRIASLRSLTQFRKRQ